jgi:HEAT repeat protein
VRAHQKDVVHLSALVLLSLACQSVCRADGTNALEQQVRHQDVPAIKAAGSQGRTDLIPPLEANANMSADPDEPVRIWAKAALAKLGAKKYLDEAVTELTTTNSELFTFYMRNGICAYPSKEGRVACATKRTQETAFEKLAYIRNPSTVKVVAQFLYSTEHYQFSTDEPPWWTSGAAVRALRQMVDNPPTLPAVHSGEEEDRAWQQWWEQNKSKYP